MDPNNPLPDNQLPKRHPFTVPDRYFEELPMRVQQRVERAPARGFSALLFFRPQVWRMALAAVLLVLVGVWVVLNQNQPSATSQEQIALADLSDAEVANYLTSNYHLLETADLATVSLPSGILPEAVPALEPKDLAEEVDLATLEEFYL